jgi:hypothetical protein
MAVDKEATLSTRAVAPAWPQSWLPAGVEEGEIGGCNLILITLNGLLLGPVDKTDIVINMQYGTTLANQMPPSRNTVFLQHF